MPTYDKELGLAIQEGIRLTVGILNTKRTRDPTLLDFQETSKITLPKTRVGTNRESKSQYFKDYAPIVFKRIRAMFGVDAADYLLSICGEQELLSQLTEGKSGAFFYFSPDRTYIIKSMTKAEAHFLFSKLHLYYNHILRNPHTLLTRYFGLHRVKKSNGSKVYLLVMNNIIDTSITIDSKYDLKGSLHQRRTKNRKPGATLKDLDFLDLSGPIEIPIYMKKLLEQQLYYDTMFLKEMNLLDYSLLLGVASSEQQKSLATESTASQTPESRGPSTSTIQHKAILSTLPSVESDSFARDRRMTARYSGSGEFLPEHLRQPTLFRPQNRKKTLQSVFQRDHGGILSLKGDKIYYVGIIDLLTLWGPKKWLEHNIKVPFQGRDISAVTPSHYASRFNDFMRENVLGIKE